MIELLLYGILAILAAAAIGLIIFARWNYGYLDGTGMPVVKPTLFLGSDPNLHKVILHDEDIKRMKKYGNVYGFYEGRNPQVYVSDPELIRLICIKDFDHFHDRGHLDFGHIIINEMLDVLVGEKWRTVRSAITPALTTGKIRVMSQQMKDAVGDMMTNIKEEFGDEKSFVLNMKQVFAILTTDIIARCAFGTNLSNVRDPDNAFVKNVQILNADGTDPTFMFTLTAAFPFLASTAPFAPPECCEFFAKVLGDIMESRRQAAGSRGGQGKQKVLGDLVDFFNELMEKVPSEEFKRLGISKTTVVSQAVLFVLAGFDTTATTLTMLTYRLASNPDKQKLLIEELDAVYAKNKGQISHDTLGDLPYLNACINESLRMAPPVIRTERMCGKDWTYPQKGLKIKKGTIVEISNWGVHYNEEFWPEPGKFRPERFLDKDSYNPYAFMSFGQGPRNCPGSRFAKEEINLTIAALLKDFTLETVPETKIQFKPGRAFLIQYQKVFLKLVRRQKK